MARVMAMVLPALAAPARLAEEDTRPQPQPPAHATDVSLDETEAWPGASAWVRSAQDAVFARSGVMNPGHRPKRASHPLPDKAGAGFHVIGNVAVLIGDEETTTTGQDGRHALVGGNMAAVSSRFIKAFGDNFDQIAVFLSFIDYASPHALAYQLPMRNTIRGLGLGMFDHSPAFGSPSGRLETMLNMKRVLLYGVDAPRDADNSLYLVWAQEAAHRWLVYFRYRRAGDTDNRDELLGRDASHWARELHAGSSSMEAYGWKDNGDGTFSVVNRGQGYNQLDQYGMGLRQPSEVQPFFLLEDLQDEAGKPAPKGTLSKGVRYRAKKTTLTIQDIERAMGPREPPVDQAAQDLRMGVVLLAAHGTPPGDVVGEAFHIDLTRRTWSDHYNKALEGRGMVCTELLRPCRGPAFTFGPATWHEAAAGGDGVLGPGEAFTLKVQVSNQGMASGKALVQAQAGENLVFRKSAIDTGLLEPNQTTTLTFDGSIPPSTACGDKITVEFTVPDKSARPSPSMGAIDVVLGLVPGPVQVNDFEQPATGWRVNPEGKDTADAGRWQQGTPEKTEAFSFTLQPGAAFSGRGAFVTGAAKGDHASANDVHGGKTTLESPPLPLTNLRTPTLSYQVYFVAADFDVRHKVLLPGTEDALIVLASHDDGVTWTEVDRVTGMAVGWQRRLVRLPGKLPPEALAAGALRFRFVAEEGGDVDNVVEAVIDDVGVLGESPSCPGDPSTSGGSGTVGTTGLPAGGCECRVGRLNRTHKSDALPVAFLILPILCALVRRLLRRRS
jgi:hypothetical protein